MLHVCIYLKECYPFPASSRKNVVKRNYYLLMVKLQSLDFYFMNYEEVFSFKNLYIANKKCKQGKEHKKEVIEFQANLGINLWDLYFELKYKKYKIKKYNKFKIYDPKEREIQAISFKDRIVQRALCDNYLIPLVSRYLINDNVACRRFKGATFAIKRIKKFLYEHIKENGTKGYFVKLDVSKFFDSIDHEILKCKLKRIVKDEDIFAFLEMVIDSFEVRSNKGLPMGNQSSQLFALLYLNDLDHFVKEKLHTKYYVRYMDDMLLVASSKKEATSLLHEISILIDNEGLKVNPKSQIRLLRLGNDFIGYRLFIGKNQNLVLKIRNETKRRILKSVKKRKYLSSKEKKVH